jgi:hypothetical protein
MMVKLSISFAQKGEVCVIELLAPSKFHEPSQTTTISL